MTAAIRTHGLTKDYGRGRGLFDLDLEVAEGEVFGYLGPNGAGKSTTIRLLMGFIHASRGSATVLGLDIQAAVDNWALPADTDYSLVNISTGKSLVATQLLDEARRS